ncbi:DinB family protein [Paenibacillus vini]|uniref:DinB-like domain-containing protein n=1 Tax=Paenibacillus vini TaxID=1476024 RepID=A0ABQ4MD46_9BACL|nr:DinB family protein [Paenibacillus vini]GIP53908.1 hypothetical protein J42TS3_29430 [Paenibacillus vini]
MSHYLFDQLHFVRKNTMKLVVGLSEEQSEVVIEGMNNHIKWNLGHLYFVLERNAFHFIGEEMSLPDHFEELYRPGSKPGNEPYPVPSLDEITELLGGQTQRIEKRLGKRLQEKALQSYTTSSGLLLTTVEEFLNFCLYHEGMHFEKIKWINKMIRGQ